MVNGVVLSYLVFKIRVSKIGDGSGRVVERKRVWLRKYVPRYRDNFVHIALAIFKLYIG